MDFFVVVVRGALFSLPHHLTHQLMTIFEALFSLDFYASPLSQVTSHSSLRILQAGFLPSIRLLRLKTHESFLILLSPYALPKAAHQQVLLTQPPKCSPTFPSSLFPSSQLTSICTATTFVCGPSDPPLLPAIDSAAK